MTQQTASVASMTGFATATHKQDFGSVTVELRSVNSRFLDLALRVPDELRHSEAAVREAISARIARGKVDCRLTFQRTETGLSAEPRLPMLQRLAAWSDLVTEQLPRATPLSVADVLRWPGVLEASTTDAEAIKQLVLAALDEALTSLLASRAREGDALRQVLRERCDRLMAVAEQLKPAVPEMLASLERKLAERLNQALSPALAGAALSREEVAERIRQEVTLYGLRADVDEELKRLITHVTEVRRVLNAGGAVGRRLDFLMQELNREANTLGSKASAIELTQAAVELKILIEQMREQIQNLE